MNTELYEGINWVGYVDWEVRDFHGYVTRAGATYNSYLIQDEKIVLVDTVKEQYSANLIKNISVLTEPSNIDYIIVNHAEPDHSSGLSKVVKACSQVIVVCNQKTKDILSAYHNTENWKFHIVKTGDTLSLGENTIQFLETPMAHWPDSMFSYVKEKKLLFSMDAFGQHYASDKRFDDEVDLTEVMSEAKKYYANILMPFGRQIQKTLETASKFDIEMIAPAHGVIWRSNIRDIISLYSDAAQGKVKNKVLILYDSMWGSTKLMAHAIMKGFSDNGIEVKVLSVRSSDLTEIATEVLDSAILICGSATLNMGMMPMMGGVLTYLKGLKPTNKKGFAFGSYG